jgi:hypothetical protein
MDNSTSTFISALWFNAALAAGFFGAFVVLRTTRPQTYAPRTYAVAKEQVFLLLKSKSNIYIFIRFILFLI